MKQQDNTLKSDGLYYVSDDEILEASIAFLEASRQREAQDRVSEIVKEETKRVQSVLSLTR